MEVQYPKFASVQPEAAIVAAVPVPAAQEDEVQPVVAYLPCSQVEQDGAPFVDV
jgi:hypothetical protein